MLSVSVSGYLAAIRWEWFRLQRRVGFWAVIAIFGLAVALSLVGAIASQSFLPTRFNLPAHAFPNVVFETLARLGPFFSVVLAGFVFGAEFGWGTWRTLSARGRGREQIVLPKMLLGGCVLVVVWATAWCASSLVGLVAGGSSATELGTALPGFPDGWGATAINFWSTLPAAAAYLTLGVLLCMAGRSTAFGVGVGIAIVIAESAGIPLLRALAALWWEVDLDGYLRWTLRGVSDGLSGKDELHSAVFLPALLAYMTVFCTVSLWIIRIRDLDSGNG